MARVEKAPPKTNTAWHGVGFVGMATRRSRTSTHRSEQSAEQMGAGASASAVPVSRVWPKSGAERTKRANPAMYLVRNAIEFPVGRLPTRGDHCETGLRE